MVRNVESCKCYQSHSAKCSYILGNEFSQLHGSALKERHEPVLRFLENSADTGKSLIWALSFMNQILASLCLE